MKRRNRCAGLDVVIRSLWGNFRWSSRMSISAIIPGRMAMVLTGWIHGRIVGGRWGPEAGESFLLHTGVALRVLLSANINLLLLLLNHCSRLSSHDNLWRAARQEREAKTVLSDTVSVYSLLKYRTWPCAAEATGKWFLWMLLRHFKHLVPVRNWLLQAYLI